MTDEEQDRIIGSDFRAKRDAERKLACLESKRAKIQKNIEMLSGVFSDAVVIDSASENTLHTHNGASINRQHRSIVVPTASDILELVREIEDTKQEIKEIEQRLSKV